MEQESQSSTRREFLRNAAAAGLSLGVLSGLGTRGPLDPLTRQLANFGGLEAASTPKRGGIVKLAMQAFDPKSFLDPALSETDFDLMSDAMLYDNLVKLDNGFTPLPALATSWEVTPDARTWTFKLRKGVEFHDGSAFTAGDVEYTVMRILAGKSLSPIHPALAAVLQPSGVKVLDPYTIRLTLSQPYSFFLTLIGGYNFRIVKNGETNFNHPIGTGPFKFGSYSPGQFFTASRNPNYWQHGLPYLDGVHVVSVPVESTMVQDIKSGTADIGDAIDVTTAQQLKNNSSIHLYTLPAASTDVIVFFAKDTPFQDLRVRQALKYAIDRERLFNVVLQGQGVVGADIPVAPTDPLYPAGLKALSYDPEKAASLLKSAGFSKGLDITIFTSTAAAFMLETAEAYQSAVGANIKVKVQQTQPSSYFSDIWLHKPSYTSFWLRVPPDTMIADGFTGNSVQNESGFLSSRFTSLINQSRQTTSLTRQKELYAEAMPIIAQQAGWFSPYWGNRIWPARANLKGVQLDFIDNCDWTTAYFDS